MKLAYHLPEATVRRDPTARAQEMAAREAFWQFPEQSTIRFDRIVDRPLVDRTPPPHPDNTTADTTDNSSDNGSGSGDSDEVSTGRIVKAFSTQLIFRVLGMLASVFTVAITTRHLGPTSYGHLTTAIVFVGLWTSFTELGIGSVIVRRVTSGTADLERLIRVNTGLSLVYCVPLSLITMASGLLIYQGEPEVKSMLIILSTSLTVSTVLTCVQPIFVTKVDFTAVAVSDLVGRMASLGATLVMIQIDAPLVWFAIAQVVPLVVQLLVQFWAAGRMIPFWPIFSWRESLSLVVESLPQTGVLIIGVLYWRADAVLLSLLSSPEQVGVYGLAYTVAFTTSVISQFFLSSTLSSMTRRFAVDKKGFAEFVEKSVETLSLVALPIGLVGVMLAGPIVATMGSDEFVSDGKPALALLFVAVTVTFMNGVLSQALFAAHDQVFLLRLNVVNLAVNIALNIVLIPSFGAVGASAALLFAEFSGLVVVTWRLHRKSPYRTPYRYMVKALVPLTATGVAVYFAHDLPLVISGVIAVVVYAVANLVFGPAKISTLKTMLDSGDEPEEPDEPAEPLPQATDHGRTTQ
ncbi:flippase [Rhodococcoides yunnanense]|uniref:flippase n=1 Tax=Rhodococcoides yunnanense TaxID=278209 RepID=UPI000B2AB43F|nr:flippase [Rhodococcus yunnanensis]